MQTRMSNKRRKEKYEIDDSRLIIPVNYSKDTIDKGYNVFEVNKNKIFVANVLGKRLGGTLNGFNVIDNIVSNLNSDIKIRIIDFHSEYGNEKASIRKCGAWHLLAVRFGDCWLCAVDHRVFGGFGYSGNYKDWLNGFSVWGNVGVYGG